MAPTTVRVPREMESIFAKAEETVAKCFAAFRADPSRGTIEVSGQRYVLVRASALSVEFFSFVRRLFGRGQEAEADEFARNILFDLAHAIGQSDAKNFHARMNLEDPIELLSAGPIHFAHSGWALVDISAESRPSPDEDYYLIYDHPYSFEADAWIQSGCVTDTPVCIMNAGYSSGWCEESFGVTLVASEILCRARGDDCCRFIMAPPHRIEAHIARYMRDKPHLAARIRKGGIPDFFVRKRMEEDLRQREEQYRRIFEASSDALLILDRDRLVVDVNPAACRLYGYTREEMVGLSARDIVPTDHLHLFEVCERDAAAAGRSGAETVHVRHDGSRVEVDVHVTPLSYQGAPHLLAVVRDITARRRVEEAMQAAARQWQSTFDAIEDLVILCDADHRILQANRAAREAVPGPELVGTRCFELVHGTQEPHPNCPSCTVFGRGEAVHVEMQEPNLGNRWFDVHAYPINNEAGTAVRMVHIIRDITERKRAEEELAKTLADLERFNRLAVGRELRMIELKREVNGMAGKAGLEAPYDLSFAEAGKAGGDLGRRRTRGAELPNTAQGRGGP